MKDHFHCFALLRVVPFGTADSLHVRLLRLMFPLLLLAYAFISFYLHPGKPP